jgi:hypothetical protein
MLGGKRWQVNESISVAKFRIPSALGVSEPYSSDIRAGKRIPHARHWQALAQLVGISAVDKRILETALSPIP